MTVAVCLAPAPALPPALPPAPAPTPAPVLNLAMGRLVIRFGLGLALPADDVGVGVGVGVLGLLLALALRLRLCSTTGGVSWNKGWFRVYSKSRTWVSV